jgi:FkbM family methyltransferase
VTPECGLRYYCFDFYKIDPALLNAAVQYIRPGDVVWDIGANLGLFSFAAASLGAEVLAVEPDCWLVELMRKSQRLNGLKVTIIPAAASDQAGIVSFNIANHGRASNFLSGFGRQIGWGSRHEVKVVAIPLDSLLAQFSPPKLIKIDVEGAEVKVLRGAQDILRRYRPKLICEVEGTQQTQEFSDLMGIHRYRMFDLERNCIPTNAPVFATLALPESPA